MEDEHEGEQNDVDEGEDHDERIPVAVDHVEVLRSCLDIREATLRLEDAGCEFNWPVIENEAQCI